MLFHVASEAVTGKAAQGQHMDLSVPGTHKHATSVH